MKISKHLETVEDNNQLEVISKPDTNAASQSFFTIATLLGITLGAIMILPTPLFFVLSLSIVAAVTAAINPLEYLNTYRIIVGNDTLTIEKKNYANKIEKQHFNIKDIEQVFVKNERDELAMFMKDSSIISLDYLRHQNVEDLLIIERLLENHMGITDKEVVYYTGQEQELMIAR